MQNYRSQSTGGQVRRISIDQALREAATGTRLQVETTKLSLSRRDSKPCGVFATVVEGPLTGFSGMIYIGDIQGSPEKPAADVLQDLVNPAGQRLTVTIKQAEIETPTNGGKRLRLGFWQHAAGEASQPTVTAEPAAKPAAPEAPMVESTVAAGPQVTVTVFINGETGGFHSVKATSAMAAESTAPELLNENGEVQTLEGALTLAVELAQQHKLQQVDIVDPARRLLTTKDALTLRASQLRSMWIPTAKRKDAASK